MSRIFSASRHPSRRVRPASPRRPPEETPPSRSARGPGSLPVVALALGATLAGGTRAAAQETAVFEPPPARGIEFPLTIRDIMRGPELVGQSPDDIAWSDDSRWIYFRWLPGGETWHADRELYRVPAEGGEPERLDDAAADSLAVRFSEGDLSPDRTRRVTSVRGDLYLVERGSGAVRRLTRTSDDEESPAFSTDGTEVFFRRDTNLFALELADGSLRQLTDVRRGPPPREEEEPEGHEAFLEAQQEELFEHIRIEKAEEEEEEAERERREADRPEPLYLAENERVGSLDPAPSGRWVALAAVQRPEGRTETIVPRWVTESGYTESDEVRAKVGDVQASGRIALLEAGSGRRAWLDLTGEGGPIEWERLDAEETEEEAEAGPEAAREEGAERGVGEEEAEGRAGGGGGRGGDERPALAVARFIGWNDAGTHGLLFAVDFDYKTWRLYALDAEAPELVLLDSHHDEAWVDGPCFPSFGGGCLGWFPDDHPITRDGPRAWYVSEETGFAHLYAIDADGTDKRALTGGEWEVLDVTIPEGRDGFLLHTSRVSPFDRHPWRIEFTGAGDPGTGQAPVQVIEGEGFFDAVPSPDGSRLAVTVSRANRPPELFVAENRPGLSLADLEQVTVSPTAEWLTFPWIEPEVVRFEARDGTRVPARIYRPADVGATPNGAGVVFVHGAGYLHNVHHAWSSYFREYMFHHFLAANGYTVLDIDYRGSAGYGRDWRTAIYRRMGGLDLSDQVDGARWLVESEGVDPDRLGIYGGSYGGFITLMAMFTESGTFEAGAALRSVTDWAHYNHWYTSRILNLPHEDEEAYRRSSPIYFAEGLEGHLLIAHGMYDTNVHFSDVVRLAQRLIELGKEDWEMAVYPVENHGFDEPTSWADEYRRIFELFERVIGGGSPGEAGGG